MKMSIRDKKIFLMFLGVLFLALSYFFVYTRQMEAAASIEAENSELQARLDQLLEMAENKEFYEEEIARMNKEIENYCETFPAAVREEDGILLVNDMEKELDVKISNVGLGEREFLSTIDGEASDTDYIPDQTLMQQSNQKTQEQINEIEGTNETSENPVSDPVDNVQDQVTELLNDAAFAPSLYRNQDTIQFVTTYKGLKSMVEYLNSRVGRMTVDSVSTSFDSSTGNLSGSMTINLYSMSNTGNIYIEPDAGDVKLGTKNIFGTIEKSGKKKKKSN